VADPHTLRQWSDVICAAIEFPDTAPDTVYRLEQGRGLGDPPTRYLGLLNGTPVAGAALHLAAGVAGIYAVGTLPEARGQGIGAAITLKPYLDARAQGYSVGILQSSSMGYKVYQRLGFRKLCDLTVYYWRGG
jgi:GNAT superfamily N-acetyltransferase